MIKSCFHHLHGLLSIDAMYAEAYNIFHSVYRLFVFYLVFNDHVILIANAGQLCC